MIQNKGPLERTEERGEPEIRLPHQSFLGTGHVSSPGFQLCMYLHTLTLHSTMLSYLFTKVRSESTSEVNHGATFGQDNSAPDWVFSLSVGTPRE